MLVRCGSHGQLFGDFYAVLSQGNRLLRVVREETHAGDTEVAQNRGADVIIAAVHRKPLHRIGIDGVEAIEVLQRVRPNLVGKSYSSTFMPAQVDQNAARVERNLCERVVELLTTITSLRTEHISRQALRVQPDQGSCRIGDVAHCVGEVFATVCHGAICVGSEVSVGCRNSGLCEAFDGDAISCDVISVPAASTSHNSSEDEIGWRFDHRTVVDRGSGERNHR